MTARKRPHRPPKTVSLKDVAKRAGTSIPTASRVLNGLGERYRISQATQDRVREVAAALRFTPNLVAKGLRLGSTRTIGLVVPDIANPFFAAIAYKRAATSSAATPRLGMILSVAAGVLMGFFYRFVVAAMATNFAAPEPGKLGPYAAIVVFSAGLFLSSFLWNTLAMVRPFQGEPVAFRAYFAGSPWVHFVGILGGIIWNIGMSLSILASDKPGPAVSYGLGQGATMVAALWGVFVWREFASAPAGTNRLLALMFVLYGAGLALLIAAR